MLNCFYNIIKLLDKELFVVHEFLKAPLRSLKIVHDFLITVQIEWIKSFHVDKTIFYDKQNFENFILTFCNFFVS